MKKMFSSLAMILMLSLASGFILFLSTMYDFASSEDMVYNRFLTEHAKQVAVKVSSTDPLESGDTVIDLDISALGDDFCLYKLVTNTVNKTSQSIRGVYSKGDVPQPPIMWGRYFTQDEMESDEPLVVVGKLIFEALEPNENGEYTYPLAGTEFKVIGCVGTEAETPVNNLILYNLHAMMKLFPGEGNYYIDAFSEQNSRDVTDAFLAFWHNDESVNNIFSASYVYPEKNSAFLASDMNRFIILSGALILLNIIMVCAQYVNEMKYTMAVKKMLGVRPVSAFGEHFLRFFIIATIGFAVGFFVVLPIVYRVMDTAYHTTYLQVNYMNVIIAYLITLAYFAVAILPMVLRIYFVDTSAELKCKE